MIRGLTRDIRQQAFKGEPATVIGTGGFSQLFEGERVFDTVLPDLVLLGLYRALALNPGANRRWQAAGSDGSNGVAVS
jgi:type III pantothenate kinase